MTTLSRHSWSIVRRFVILCAALGVAVALVIGAGGSPATRVLAQAVGPASCGNPSGGSPPGTFTVGASFVCTFVLQGGTGSAFVLGNGFVVISGVTSSVCPTGSYNSATSTFTCPVAAQQLLTTTISETVTLTPASLAFFGVGNPIGSQYLCLGPVVGCGGNANAVAIFSAVQTASQRPSAAPVLA